MRRDRTFLLVAPTFSMMCDFSRPLNYGCNLSVCRCQRELERYEDGDDDQRRAPQWDQARRSSPPRKAKRRLASSSLCCAFFSPISWRELSKSSRTRRTGWLPARLCEHPASVVHDPCSRATSARMTPPASHGCSFELNLELDRKSCHPPHRPHSLCCLFVTPAVVVVVVVVWLLPTLPLVVSDPHSPSPSWPLLSSDRPADRQESALQIVGWKTPSSEAPDLEKIRFSQMLSTGIALYDAKRL